MNIQSLIYFQNLVQTESIRQAAKYCQVYPATITTAMQRLATETHMTLYELTAAGIVITEEGYLLYQTVEKILTILRECHLHFLAKSLTITGEWRIGALGGITSFILAPFSVELAQNFSNIALNFRICSTKDILNQLMQNELDVGYIHLNDNELSNWQNHYPDIIFDNFITCQFVFLASRQHPLAKKKHLDRKSLRPYKLAFYDHNNTFNRTFWQDFLRQYADIETIFITSESRLSQMIKEENYLTLVPYLNQRLFISSLDVRSQVLLFPQEIPKHNRLYCVYRATNHSPILADYLTFLRHFYA